jgi:hypothetical protein
MTFQTLSDLAEGQPPVRFNFDEDAGLMVAADDVLAIMDMSIAGIAMAALKMTGHELDPNDIHTLTKDEIAAKIGLTDESEFSQEDNDVAMAANIGCSAISVVRGLAEGVFLEANFHAGTAEKPTDSTE